MQSLLKYFETKHNFISLIHIDKGSNMHSISESKMLQLFFSVILNYYYSRDILIDYSDKTISRKIKLEIIMKLFPIMYEEKAQKLFNLVDFMFSTLKDTIICTKKGFREWVETIPVRLQFSHTIMPNIDVFFYIIFIKVFPEDLKIILKKELRISDLEDSIINKCKDSIIKKNCKICNIQDKTPIDFSLNSSQGIVILLKILSDFRSYDKRRNSKK